MEPKKRVQPWLYIGASLSVMAGGLGLYKVVTMSRETPSSSSPSNADASYTLRGVIDTLPQATGPDKYIKIHHEELPSFKNKKGEVVGMPEMIMDFEQVSPEVKLGEFKEGDAVEFTFEVRWSPRVVTRVTRMRKLAAGTDLGLKAVTEGK
jgi:Cu/Ag efflux protein CusF